MPLWESRGGASGGVGATPPTVPRLTNPKRKSQQGAGSEASLPVTSRFLRSASQLALSTCRPLARPSIRNTKRSRTSSKSHSYPKRRYEIGNQKSRIYYLYGAVREIRGASDCRRLPSPENPTSAKAASSISSATAAPSRARPKRLAKPGSSMPSCSTTAFI